MLQHTHQSGHTVVSIDNSELSKDVLKILKMKLKISEALLIKKYKSSLNKQEYFVPIILFI